MRVFSRNMRKTKLNNTTLVNSGELTRRIHVVETTSDYVKHYVVSNINSSPVWRFTVTRLHSYAIVSGSNKTSVVTIVDFTLLFLVRWMMYTGQHQRNILPRMPTKKRNNFIMPRITSAAWRSIATRSQLTLCGVAMLYDVAPAAVAAASANAQCCARRAWLPTMAPVPVSRIWLRIAQLPVSFRVILFFWRVPKTFSRPNNIEVSDHFTRYDGGKQARMW